MFSEALRLPEDDRVLLINQLADSLHLPDDPDERAAWQQEVAQRIADVESGRVKLVPWSQARRQIAGDGGTAGD